MANTTYSNPTALAPLVAPNYRPEGFLGGVQYGQLQDVFRDQLSRGNRADDLNYDKSTAELEEWKKFAPTREAENTWKKTEAELRTRYKPQLEELAMDKAKREAFMEQTQDTVFRLEAGIKDIEGKQGMEASLAINEWGQKNGLQENHPFMQALHKAVQKNPKNGASLFLKQYQQALMNTPKHLADMDKTREVIAGDLEKERMGNISREKVGEGNNKATIQAAQIAADSRIEAAKMKQSAGESFKTLQSLAASKLAEFIRKRDAGATEAELAPIKAAAQEALQQAAAFATIANDNKPISAAEIQAQILRSLVPQAAGGINPSNPPRPNATMPPVGGGASAPQPTQSPVKPTTAKPPLSAY